MLVVDRRRQDTFPERHQAGDALDRARRTQQVSGHRLGRTDGQLARVGSEDCLEGRCLLRVAQRRGGAVSINVLDFFGSQPGILESDAHGTRAAFPSGRHGRLVIRVRREPQPQKLAQDLSPAPTSVLQLFQDYRAGSLSHHEAVALRVEGPAGALRFVIAPRQRFGRSESSDGGGQNRRFGTAGDHHLGLPVLDLAGSLADGIGRRSAGRNRGEVGPLGAQLHRNHARRHVGDHHGHIEWTDPPRTLLHQDRVLLFVSREPADPGPPNDAHAFGIDLFHVETGVAHRFHRRVYGVVGEWIVATNVFAIQRVRRIEVL